jgi:tRNA pseudouridine55 synthase
MKLDKEYLATLELGRTSTTGDPEGEITELPVTTIPKKKELEAALKSFTGEITQTPPAFSAIKVNGRRAYELARKGEPVKLKSRQVNIYHLEILDYSWPQLQIKVACSSGTYIRALAMDIGKKLGTGAYLGSLKRTKIGQFEISQAQTVEESIRNL